MVCTTRILLLFACLVTAGVAQPVTPEDFLERAREHFDRRRFLNALDSLRVVLEMTANADARENSTKREAEILSAKSLASIGRRDEAANMYERAIVHGYEEKSAYSFLGGYFEGRGQWQKSAGYYARYFQADKGDATTHIRYAVVLGRLGKRDEARQLLAAIEANPQGQKSETCDLLERKKKLREAVACFGRFRNGFPDRELGYLALYRVTKELRDAPAAQRHALELYYLFGDQPRHIWPLIETRIAEKRFYDARVLLEEVVRLRGSDSDAEKLLANLRHAAPRATDRPWRATPAEMRLLEDIEREAKANSTPPGSD